MLIFLLSTQGIKLVSHHRLQLVATARIFISSSKQDRPFLESFSHCFEHFIVDFNTSFIDLLTPDAGRYEPD